MIQNFFFSISLINLVLTILAWAIIGYLVFHFYKKRQEKPKVWKVVLTLLIGLFSFSLNWYIFDEIVRIPILPLGVWILYLFFRGKENNWTKYRPYAWIGFFANFIFLITYFVSIPIQHFIYPPDKPSTYLSNIEDTSIVVTHPSGKKSLLNKKSLLSQLPTMKEENFFSDTWYDETFMKYDRKTMKERFPYQLHGASAKWGSGLSYVINIEKDGKGILISTTHKQYYFRSNQTFMMKGGE
ncbi:hypothetical protein ACQKP0_13700 [Heyndrickxia sp. NPDC080065]|uniref:hypothetical protein n=1 Tax=Heyndrickxia sp. NPDC080065 TaxID=3390568 RepID=UPI003D00B422